MIMRLISPAGTRVETSDELGAELVRVGWKSEDDPGPRRGRKPNPKS